MGSSPLLFPLRATHHSPALGSSGEQQGCQEAGQQETATSEAGGRLGRAIAEIGVTAVDADPRQLLLLAVTGGGTAAGQQDAQDHCKASRWQNIRDGGCELWGFALDWFDQLPPCHDGPAIRQTHHFQS